MSRPRRRIDLPGLNENPLSGFATEENRLMPTEDRICGICGKEIKDELRDHLLEWHPQVTPKMYELEFQDNGPPRIESIPGPASELPPQAKILSLRIPLVSDEE